MYDENEIIIKTINNNGKFLYKNSIIAPYGKTLNEVLINLFNEIKNKQIRQDDVLLLEGNSKSIDNMDLFDKNLNNQTQDFILEYRQKINNIEKPNFNNLNSFNKSFEKELTNIIKCNYNDSNSIMFDYNIKQQIQIDFNDLYDYMNKFINEDESSKFESLINLDNMENILSQKNEVIKNLEKDLMFFLFEHYNKHKKINHIDGIMKHTKDLNLKVSKSLEFIINNYDFLNTKLTKKIKYFEDKQKDYYILFDDIISLFPYGLADFTDKSYSKDKNNIFTKIQTVKTKQNTKPQTDEEIKDPELSIYYKLKFEQEINKLSNIDYESNDIIIFNYKIIKYGLFNILFLIDYIDNDSYLKTINDFMINIDNYSNNFKNKEFNEYFIKELNIILDKVNQSELYNNYNINKDVVLSSLDSIFKEDKDINLTYYINFISFYKYLEYCNLNIYNQFNKEVDFSKLREVNFISTEINNKTIDYKINVCFNFFKDNYKLDDNINKEDIIINSDLNNYNNGNSLITFGKYKDKSVKEVYEFDKNFIIEKSKDKTLANKILLKDMNDYLNEINNINIPNTIVSNDLNTNNKIKCKYNTKYINILFYESIDYLDKYTKAANEINNGRYKDYNFDSNKSYKIDLSDLFKLYNNEYCKFNIYQKILFELNFNLILNSYFSDFSKEIYLNNNEISINCISLVSKEGTSELTNILYNTINDLSLNLTSINKNIYFNKQTFNFNKLDNRAKYLMINELKNKMNSSKVSLMENSPLLIENQNIENSYLIMCKYDFSMKKYYVLEFLIQNNKIKIGYNIHDYINFNVINSNIEKYKIKNTFFVINKKNSFSNEINNLEKEFYKNINTKCLFLYQTSDSKIYDNSVTDNTFGYKHLNVLNGELIKEDYDYKIVPLFSINTFVNLNKKDNTIINISKGNLYLVNALQTIDKDMIELFYKIITLSHIKFTSKAIFPTDFCIIKNNNMRNLWKNSDSEKIVNVNNKKYNLLLTSISSIFIGLKNDK